MPGFFRKDACEKEYKLGKVLGTGSFATVRLATSKTDGKTYAVKIIKKKDLSIEDREGLQMEVEILQKVSHPNIVNLHQIFDTKDTFYMVMELMTGGELFDRIVDKGNYTEEEARLVIKQLAKALQYCHDFGVVHRDLKPENLLYEDQTEAATIKIADFGLAKLLGDADTMMMTACGTPGYVAPEILYHTKYTPKVDMWSLGVITYILLCGFPPFYSENNAELFKQIKAAAYDFPSPYWDDVSEDAKSFIRELLIVDPEKRMSAEQALAHKWIEPESTSHTAPLNAAAQLKKFNARRKLRAGMKMARAMAAMKRLSLSAKPHEKFMAAMAAADQVEKEEEEAAAGGGGGDSTAQQHVVP